LISEGNWSGAGVVTPEQMNPDPFLDRMGPSGMPWQVRDDSKVLDTPRIAPVEATTRPFRNTAAA
jgi:saccharopine dehydrogenase-like NADP-dependent oxidoreductase